MEQDQITTIRQFNREYVQLLGVLDRRVFDTELPFPEARILLMIFEQQSIRPIDVAAALSVDKGYVSRLIRQLEAKQFVKKSAVCSGWSEQVIAIDVSWRCVGPTD
ncbi:MarR family winged helix-turn-helix transcriptional regulator [Secundilactobacillus kimchicus]|uniref:MarR family winged helix-turn-helix transcriptional regulator n=1 Tax=Secundilactobacillus kimchicus TaxID=528209 RepID=UPI0006D11690|nr:MarR family transcriptional regulator [Secundilactobacillus kimchicus]